MLRYVLNYTKVLLEVTIDKQFINSGKIDMFLFGLENLHSAILSNRVIISERRHLPKLEVAEGHFSIT